MAIVVANTFDPVGYVSGVFSALGDVLTGKLSVNGNYDPAYIQSQIEQQASDLIKASGDTMDRATALAMAAHDWQGVPSGTDFKTQIAVIAIFLLVLLLIFKVA